MFLYAMKLQICLMCTRRRAEGTCDGVADAYVMQLMPARRSSACRSAGVGQDL